MKKPLALLFVLIFLLSPFCLYEARAVEPSNIRSRTAVLMDAQTGQVLYNKGMHQRVYPASTTKILTALLVVENARPHEIMTVTETALEDVPWYGAHIALVPGEEISVEDALFALMLPPANDAANVLAEHVAGSVEAFTRMMTERAHAIGAVNSNFTNTHGLHCEYHYTTAYDMALITRHAMENEDFRFYFGAERHLMQPSNKNYERNWWNLQYMLLPESHVYCPYVTGGKVGFTNQARHTMSTSATRDGRTLICVVMYSTGRRDKFLDTAALLEFGFEEFEPFTVEREYFSGSELPVLQQGRMAGRVVFEAREDFTALVHISADVSQLQIRYQRPRFYNYGSPEPYIVRFEAPNALPFVPSLLGTVELEPTVDIPVMATVVSVYEPEEWRWQRSLRIAAMVLGGIVAVCLILCLLLIIARRRRIKKLRRLRMERRLREAARGYYTNDDIYRRPKSR